MFMNSLFLLRIVVLKKNAEGELYLQTMFHSRAEAVQDLLELKNTPVLYTLYGKEHKEYPGIHYPFWFDAPKEGVQWVYAGRTKAKTLVDLIKDKNIISGAYIPLKVERKAIDFGLNFLAYLRVLKL